MEPTIVAIDAGTTGVSAVLFDARLGVLARAYREFAQSYPRPGWVEHDASAITGALDQVLAELARDPRTRAAAAIGITNQRETVFAVERRSGRPLARGIVWQDRRTADRCAELRRAGRERELRARTGLVLDPYFSGTKIEWLLRHVDGLTARARRGEVVFCTVDALILGHLGGWRDVATDPTNASRTMLYDIGARRWDPEACALFGVEPAWLPEVRPSAGAFGHVAPAALGRALPVLGIAGDQQAALLGQGCVRAGQLKITYGTGCFLLLHAGDARADVEGFVSTLALDGTGGSCFAVEGSVFIGGAVIQFLRDQFGFLERAEDSEALARSVPDTAGVHFVPAFTGLGAPYWDADVRGAILGLTRGTTRAHVVRAALEAIAFQNAELVDALRERTGHPIAALLADGGAAANGLLMQIQADLAGARVLRSPELAATARGAAALAGLGLGLWPAVTDAAALRAEPGAFEPSLPTVARDRRMSDWRDAVARARGRAALDPNA